jgi:hypothetical protein
VLSPDKELPPMPSFKVVKVIRFTSP